MTSIADCLSICIELAAEYRRESDGTTRFQHQLEMIKSSPHSGNGFVVANRYDTRQ